MKVLKTIALYTIGFFILIQFIPVSLPSSSATDPKQEIKAPAEIMRIFKVSCYDCHSNSVEYPWYAHVAPFSWSVSRHVDLGRKWVNFSIWETYSQKQKDEKLGHIYKAIHTAMPLRGYVKMHPEAELTREQRNMIRDWTGKAPF